MRILIKLVRWTLLLAVLAVAVLLGIRIWDVQRGPSLSLWHEYAPDELEAEDLAGLDWAGWLAAEDALFAQVRANVTDELPESDRIASNRYFAGSPIYPGKFATDWNRSYLLEPDGEPKGAVVLLHGLTDAPYSLRHVARLYRERGFVAIGIRLPGHGTVPAGLAVVDWEDWTQATRLAVREARRRAGGERPLHLVGFSNGGALAMQYALDALDDASLARPDRLILITPMIGVTELARFAGVLGWPALLPRFASAAWLSVTPEFNPFKYNSFPINGARQSSLLSRVVQGQLTRLAREQRLGELAPVLTFQSLVDFTVSTRAIVSDLYGRLPENGSELVLFDLNRNTKVSSLLRSQFETAFERLLPAPPRRYRTTLLTNANADSPEARARARRERRAPAHDRAHLSTRGLLALPHLAPVSGNGSALRLGARRRRVLRREPRDALGPRRDRRADPPARLAGPALVESVLSVCAGADRRGDPSRGRRRARRAEAVGSRAAGPIRADPCTGTRAPGPRIRSTRARTLRRRRASRSVPPHCP